MRTPVQKPILNFIRQNPDCQMSEIIVALTGLGRSSISSTLPKLVRQGRPIPTVGINQRYEYRIVVGELLRLSKPMLHTVSVAVIFYPSDNRKRDLDNSLKALFDSMTNANVWPDVVR